VGCFIINNLLCVDISLSIWVHMHAWKIVYSQMRDISMHIHGVDAYARKMLGCMEDGVSCMCMTDWCMCMGSGPALAFLRP